LEGVVVTDVGSVDSLRELFALLGWDNPDPVRSLRVTTTKSLVTLATVAVFVLVIHVSALSVGGIIFSMDALLICKISEVSPQFVLLCIISEADVIN
jgi:hypothetical protein